MFAHLEKNLQNLQKYMQKYVKYFKQNIRTQDN